MRSTPRHWPSIHRPISSLPTSAICSITICLHSSRRTERQTSRTAKRGNKIAATSALLQDTMEMTHGGHGHKQQFQGRRLSRQRSYSVSRLWLRLRGQQPIAASGVVGSTRRHEELRRYLPRSGCANGQRVLALAGGEHPAECNRACRRCRQSEGPATATGSAADSYRLRHARLWRSVSAGGRPSAPLSVHGFRGRDREPAGDSGYLSRGHRLPTAFQYARQGGDHGPLQAMTVSAKSPLPGSQGPEVARASLDLSLSPASACRA